MSVLVTGGAGFVGTYVVRDLMARGERIVVYDRTVRGNALELVLRSLDDIGVSLVEGTIVDEAHLLDVCEREAVDRIVHLASPLTQDVDAQPVDGIRDICLGTATVLEVARLIGARRVVWASSVAVFGARSRYGDAPVANNAPHLPATLYGSCKSLCERLAADYRERHTVDSIGLRLSVVYGPGRLRGYMSFPSELVRHAALGRSIEIPLADQLINWQYVGEVSAMIIAALDVPRTVDAVFNTVGEPRSFREAAQILARLAPDVSITVTDATTNSGQEALREAPFSYDDAAFRSQVGYQPRFPLERGIEETFRVFRRFAEQEHLSL